jgi:hypothetical protein
VDAVNSKAMAVVMVFGDSDGRSGNFATALQTIFIENTPLTESRSEEQRRES